MAIVGALARSPSIHVLEYHLLAYRRSFRGSLFSTFLQPILFLAAMGVSLGGIVDRAGANAALGGVSYLSFLAPGLLAAAGMQTAFFESTYPIIAAIVWVRTFFAMLATPISARSIVLGQLLYIVVRLAFTTGIFAVIVVLFGAAHGPGILLAWGAAVLTGLAFAAPLAAYSATRETPESFNALFRFGMTPLFLFSGTFFPIERLPGFLQPIAALTPLYHGVALARGFALGTGDPGVLVHLGYLVLLAAGGAIACLVTFERRLVR